RLPRTWPLASRGLLSLASRERNLRIVIDLRDRFREPVLKCRRRIITQKESSLSLAFAQQVQSGRSRLDCSAEQRFEFTIAVERERLAHYLGCLIVAVHGHQRLRQLESQRRKSRVSLRAD